MDTSTTESKISILMLPWLAHGHVTPYFELAKKLSLKNFKVYFCSTPINLQPIREKTNFPLIQLIDLHLPSSFHQVLPPHFHTTKNLPPHLNSTLMTAFDEAKPAFCNLLKVLKPNLVMYDLWQPWAPESSSGLNIKAVMFLITSAIATAALSHFSMRPSLGFPWSLPESEIQNASYFLQMVTNGMTTKDRWLTSQDRSSSVILINTSKEIEAKYVDYLSDLSGKEVVTVGPFVQEAACKDADDADIINWLNQRDPCSVVYVSFGSEYFLSKEEREEIARGLELSKIRFIWVVRLHGGDAMTIHDALPESFLKRVEGKGLVLEGWAPQGKILGHPSLGGFVSHCGWNSVVEGISFGVPIIAMPMHFEQPMNARIVVENGVGLEVPRKDGKIDGEEMAKVIHEVLADERGNRIRGRARELGGKLRETRDEEWDFALKKLEQLVVA